MTPELERSTRSASRMAGAGHQHALGDPPPSLERVRGEIDRVDRTIIELLEHRGRLAAAARACKERLNLPVFDPAREAAIVRQAAERAATVNLDPEVVRDIYWRIVQLARIMQIDHGDAA